ncbi:MAG TPA: PIN domain-containing protein [Rhodoglobus sp.]|nr:PIN domain-containing protein [Rhodoglobus sp.]
MARRLILDTSILIAAERSEVELDHIIEDDDDVVIAAVTAAELLTGVELAVGVHRDRRAKRVHSFFEVVPVEPYDLTTAEHHAILLAHVRRSGEPRGAHDLMIAATATATGRTILSSDRAARFDDLPGIAAIIVN